MPFDDYIRSISVAAIIYAVLAYIAQVASQCDGFLLVALLTFIQVPVLALALVFPLIWRLVQGRPIERKTVILAMWAVTVTVLEIALTVFAPASGYNCFK